MILSGYEEVEHTADIALRVWGEDFFDLLRQSAWGMYELMGIKRNRELMTNVNFEIGQGSMEMQLVDFLNELLFLVDDKWSCFDNFSFGNSMDIIVVSARGCKIGSYQRSIKAVTFHNLDILETKTGFETMITFDV
ncbi:MAG: archease [Brevefilum sp.]|nr:archease [Brevefilum sp.]MDT8381175.1 archease [Brevefilum sp.]MDW7755527.1 archease [Brevefilum sp.]